MFPFYKTVAEAALPMNQSHDALRGHLRTALMAAHGVNNTYDEQGPWVNDVFPGHVVYSHKGQNYKRSYTATQGAAGSDPTVTVGAAKKVHVAYVSSATEALESMRALFDLPQGLVEDMDWFKAVRETHKPETAEEFTLVRESVTFCEPAVTEGIKVTEASKTRIPVCIIKPGWGSMAYYSEAMIKATGPQAFKKGTQMFLNHATETEQIERPEGDVNDLASVLDRDAYWNANGPVGAGLYSEAMVFPDHEEQIMSKGPYIGCSINAAIKAAPGTVDGRTGMIAQSFEKAYSVDYVTKAGAGGAPIVPVTESQRGSAPITDVKESNMPGLTDAEVQALRDRLDAAEAKNKVMEAQQNVILAVATVGTLVREAGFTVKASLLERVCGNPKMTTEGKVDLDWAKSVKEDLVGVAEAGGSVTGLGEQHLNARESNTQKAEEADKKRYSESLQTLGVPEAGLKYALGDFR